MTMDDDIGLSYSHRLVMNRDGTVEAIPRPTSPRNIFSDAPTRIEIVPEEPPLWLAFIFGAVFGAIVLGVLLMPLVFFNGR